MGSYTFSTGHSWSLFIFHDNIYDAFLMPSSVPMNSGSAHEDGFLPARINARVTGGEAMGLLTMKLSIFGMGPIYSPPLEIRTHPLISMIKRKW